MVTITAQNIRDLHNARFGDDEAVLAYTSGDSVAVKPRHVAQSDTDVARIVTTATDVHEYSEGDLTDDLAGQLAAELTRDLAEGLR